MRVVHVMAPGLMGGAEQVVLDLTRVLDARDIDVHLVLILDAGHADHPVLALAAQGVSVHPLLLPPRRYDLERKRVRAAIGEIGTCVVHTHGYRADVVDGGVVRAMGLPTVTTVHGSTGGGLRNRLYEWVQRRAFRGFDAVVAVSRPLARDLESRGIRAEQIHTIPNARVRPDRLLESLDARGELGAPQSSFHVGWIGRVSHEKGPDVMLSALKLVAEGGRVRDLRATFLGDGAQRTELEERTRELGLEGVVHWAGRVEGAAALFRGFDVIVLSSRTEGTPIVGLEAMLAEVPLVATFVGGVPDLTGDRAAFLVPSEDPDALAGAIERVFADPEGAAQRVQAARERVQEVASPRAWAERYLDVYRHVLHGYTR